MDKINFIPGSHGVLVKDDGENKVIAIISPIDEEKKILLAIKEEWALDEDDVIYIEDISYFKHSMTWNIQVKIIEDGDENYFDFTLDSVCVY
jgi:hypothetical protein